MKTLLLLLALVVWAAVSARPAEGAPADAAVTQQDDDSASATEEEAAAGKLAVPPQDRSNFCLDDWEYKSGSCYQIFHFPDSWSNAESHCAEFDSSLASVHSIWEYTHLQRMARKGGHSFAWIGGYNFQGNWRWEDGSRFDYEKWNFCSNSDFYQCLQLNSESKVGWSNHNCDRRFPYICKKNLNC